MAQGGRILAVAELNILAPLGVVAALAALGAGMPLLAALAGIALALAAAAKAARPQPALIPARVQKRPRNV